MPLGHAIRRFIVIGLVFCLLPVFGLAAQSGSIGLYSRQWTSLPATDSTWYYLNSDGSANSAGGGSYPAVQWIISSVRSTSTNNAVLLRSTGSITFTIKYYNGSSAPGFIQWSVTGGSFTQTSNALNPVTPLTGTYPTTQVNIGVGEWGSFSFTLSGLPDVVCYGDVYANLQVAIASTPPLRAPSNNPPVLECHLYQVDSGPTDIMSTPWADVLNYSCLFGDSQTGPATLSKKCTEQLWGAGLFTYNDNTANFIQFASGSNQGKFMLSYFLTHAKPAAAECRDISSVLLLCLETQGIACSLHQLWGGVMDGSDAKLFTTNLIRASGLGSYNTTAWHFHQVVEETDGMGNATVYDACAKQQFDLSGASFKDTPYAWPESGYWQTANGTTFLGLVNGWTSTPLAISPVSIGALLRGPVVKGVSILQGVF